LDRSVERDLQSDYDTFLCEAGRLMNPGKRYSWRTSVIPFASTVVQNRSASAAAIKMASQRSLILEYLRAHMIQAVEVMLRHRDRFCREHQHHQETCVSFPLALRHHLPVIEQMVTSVLGDLKDALIRASKKREGGQVRGYTIDKGMEEGVINVLQELWDHGQEEALRSADLHKFLPDRAGK
jgi:hypothetical protein